MSKNSNADKTHLTQTEISFHQFETLNQKRAEKVLKGNDVLIPVLRIIEGENKGEHYLLSHDESTIGRGSDCTFSFKDPKMSRTHAQIVIEKKSSEREQFIVTIVDLKSRNGVWVNLEKITHKIELKNGDTIKIGSLTLGFYLKFSEEIDLENYLFKLATRDSMTGLLTKAFFDSSLEFEFRRSQRYLRPFSFVIMDLDHFKKVNDSYGHLVGDIVLKEVGKILMQQLRFEDTAIRYGGEEFAIILPETKTEAAFVVLERIKKNIQEHLFTTDKGKSFHVTASFGLCQFNPQIKSCKELVTKADEALYEAKNSGRNKICHYQIKSEKASAA